MQTNEFIRKKCIAYNMMNYREISKVLNELGDIKYAIIKGEPLSLMCYGALGMRHCGDIDILISRKNISKIENVLKANGYISRNDDVNIMSRKTRIMCLSHSHQIPPYIKETDKIVTEVDLNFDIFWGEYFGKRIDIDEFISDNLEVEIYGVKVRTLQPLKAMVQLILHHYKEMNSIYHLANHNSITYNMFEDLYCLLINNQEAITVNSIYDIAYKHEIIPYVFYMLYYTSQVFKDKLLLKYVDALYTQQGENLLNCYGLAEDERKEWKFDFKTRLEADELFPLIRYELTPSDYEKLERNRKIFG